MPVKRTHEFQIDNIRALAIMTVVVGHSIILYSSSWGIYQPVQSSVLLDYIKRVINLYQMPLFFSLSGYLFAASGSEISFLRFIKKKALRILIPFLTVGLFWMIPVKFLAGYPAYSSASYCGAVRMFLDGSDVGHLWYLPTLFCFFLISYLLCRLFQNRISTWVIASILGLLASLLIGRIYGSNLLYRYLIYFTQFFWSFPFGALIFKLKHWKAGNPESQRIPLWAKVAVVVTCLVSIYAALFLSEKLSLLSSLLILSTIYIVIPERKGLVFCALSKNSFGLYLFHSPLTYVTYSFALSYFPAAVFAINLLVWGTVAWLVTVCLRKIPLRFVIGE